MSSEKRQVTLCERAQHSNYSSDALIIEKNSSCDFAFINEFSTNSPLSNSMEQIFGVFFKGIGQK